MVKARRAVRPGRPAVPAQQRDRRARGGAARRGGRAVLGRPQRRPARERLGADDDPHPPARARRPRRDRRRRRPGRDRRCGRCSPGWSCRPRSQSRCDVAGSPYSLSTEQAANAATISAVAVKRELPARAVTIALATALQESKLNNVEYGDRDSLGLFQQRPSPGLGQPRADPRPALRGREVLRRAGQGARLGDASSSPRPRRRCSRARTRRRTSSGRTRPTRWPRRSPGRSRRCCPARSRSRRWRPPRPRCMQLLALELPHTRAGRPPTQAGELRPVAAWATVGWLVAKADRLGIEAVAHDGRRWTRTDGWRVDSVGPGGPDPLRGRPDPAVRLAGSAVSGAPAGRLLRQTPASRGPRGKHDGRDDLP